MSTLITMQWQIAGGVRVRFSAKPPAEVIGQLKAAGFRWSPAGGEWWRNRTTGAADVLDRIDRLLRPKDQPDGACWKCGAPGRFRNRGAAAPVFCDRCAAEPEGDATPRPEEDVPVCPRCGQANDSNGEVCPDCWAEQAAYAMGGTCAEGGAS